MAKPKIIKASVHEKMDYGGTYPLYGWVFVTVEETGKDLKCPVELCIRLCPDDAKYELMAPDGYIFREGIHSKMCFTLEDLRDRAGDYLILCPDDCNCKSPSMREEQ